MGHHHNADGPYPCGEALSQTDEETGEGGRQVEAVGRPGAVCQAKGTGADDVDHRHNNYLLGAQVGKEDIADSGYAFTCLKEEKLS